MVNIYLQIKKNPRSYYETLGIRYELIISILPTLKNQGKNEQVESKIQFC